MFKRINLVPGLVPEEHSFPDFPACTKWLESYLHMSEDGTLKKIVSDQRDGYSIVN